jgi:hypothetical protein
VRNTLYGAGHDKTSEIQRAPDLLFEGRSLEQLLRARQIPARPRPCHGGLTPHPTTHQRQEWPQPAFREYSKEDGTRHLQDAHSQQSCFLRHHPGNAATPLGSVVLQVTFGTKDNYRTKYIKFEVADFDSSFHAILGRPALAKFMAVPHYD